MFPTDAATGCTIRTWVCPSPDTTGGIGGAAIGVIPTKCGTAPHIGDHTTVTGAIIAAPGGPGLAGLAVPVHLHVAAAQAGAPEAASGALAEAGLTVVATALAAAASQAAEEGAAAAPEDAPEEVSEDLAEAVAGVREADLAVLAEAVADAQEAVSQAAVAEDGDTGTMMSGMAGKSE